MAATSNKLNLEDKIKFLNEDGIDLENKIIYLWGELEENLGTTLRVKSSVLRLFWEAEKKQSLTEISLDISSYGGSIYSIYGAIDFYDELKSDLEDVEYTKNNEDTPYLEFLLSVIYKNMGNESKSKEYKNKALEDSKGTVYESLIKSQN